jgi:hypothetical protein
MVWFGRDITPRSVCTLKTHRAASDTLKKPHITRDEIIGHAARADACRLHDLFTPRVTRTDPLSRYSDWLRARWPRCLSSSHGRIKNIAQTGSGVHPAYCPMGPVALSPGVKWQGREADHSTPTSAQVKKTWSIHSPIHFRDVLLN